MKKYNWFVIIELIFGVVLLLFEHTANIFSPLRGAVFYLYFAVLGLFLTEFLVSFFSQEYKRLYVKKNFIPLFLIGVYLLLLVIRLTGGKSFTGYLSEILPIVVIIRALFLLFNMYERLKHIETFVLELFSHPARTILISFVLVILIGMTLLQFPVATADHKGLDLIDALFTSTSAVCVTGLIVVDTAAAFTLFGKLVIIVLIQIGGLSIIILSFFVIFVLRKKVSIEGKMLISYVLSEKDVNSVSSSLKRIIGITFLFEGAGALLLSIRFYGLYHHAGKAALFGVFHSVSAFCNAGFALFTDSLEQFTADPLVNIVIALLIILGGLSFVVIINIMDNLKGRFHRRFRGKKLFIKKLSLNTKTVLGVTLALLISGMFLIYALEHGNMLKGYSTAAQYLAAFFQSVTLRTAGFNTIPFGELRTATLLIMMLYMFIGGASGSTAGGIKVNTFTILLMYIKANLKNEQKMTLFKHSIGKEYVMRGILIVLFGISAIAVGAIVLSITETAPFEKLLFETVSAFGTVGLSTGITSSLTIVGKIVIIILMFIGRTGPLTFFAAMSEKEKKIQYEYPYGDILIG